MKGWTTRDIPDQFRKVSVVTGANTGIGYQTALALAGAGADVIVAARNTEKGRDAVARILSSHPSAQVSFEKLDLASLRSVSDFAARMEAVGRPLDLLINNAGLASPPRRAETQDGFELQFGVNFLGHFALTAQLLPMLLKAAAPRVVTLSSIMHKVGKINFDDLMSERSYSPVASYNQSKLATLLFARKLQRRADAEGWNLISLASHPGVSRTELSKARPAQPVLWFNWIGDLIAPLFTGTASNGALPTLYAATSPDIEKGGYYGPTGWNEIKGPPGQARSTPASQDPTTANLLWEHAQHYTGLNF
ncbi:SDR family oxidoreductase [Gluconobacter kondonii]|nr:SDR family oxidoreductase [Gluconobacter kondonii]